MMSDSIFPLKIFSIGITGTYAAGKDTVADYLVDNYNFYHLSLSDIIRDEADKRGLPHSRDVLISLGREIREKFGEGELAKRAAQKAAELGVDRVVITSIRHPHETLRRLFEKFFLWAIDAPRQVRFTRAKARGKLADQVDFDTFAKQEESEMATSGPGQQLGRCISLANVTIDNSGSLADLYKKIDDILETIIN